MCGICGELRSDGNAASTDAVQRMTEEMQRRGPDAMGVYAQDAVALGHRRLSIIDLSARAQQPMVDSELGLSVVYNGAIYNFRELRAELRDQGYRFFSDSDTEVILKAYHAWGSACVSRFNGMFAFAIWQREARELFIARDRLGIKPLYYTTDNGVFRFASSLPALLAGGPTDTEIDPVGFHHYMTFHSVVPAPHTILRGVKKLPPGATMTVDAAGGRIVELYWDLDFTPRPEERRYTIEDWKAKIHEKLRQAVERRLVADVPVGVLLSGGLDSSLVVGLLDEAGHDHIETFSIGFETVGEEKGDEFEYSDIIVEHFRTKHHKIRIDTSALMAELYACVQAMSEPMVSHDCIGFYLLSKEVAKHVKVVESGQGADELFAGYHWYPPLLDVAADDATRAYQGVFFDRSHEEFAMSVDPRFLVEDFSRSFVDAHFARPGAERAVDKALRLDMSVMLVDDPVKRVDNMTMGWGLEARVPFLDHELVELAARVPAELKVAGGGKHVLKEVARAVIPDAVIDRPKGYFPVPALKYIRGDYLNLVRNILRQPEATARRLFNHDYVETLLADPEGHITPLKGSKLWQLTVLEYWLQAHGI